MFIRRIETLLFALLMLCALAVPAQAQNTQNCASRGDCTFNDASTNATGGTVTVGAITLQGSGATIGDVDGSAAIGDVEASVGDVTGGSVGDVDGGAGGSVEIKYPDQPVSSPAMVISGICSSGASVSTKGMGVTIGTSDQLCRHMELIKMGLTLKKVDDVERLWTEVLAMERRGSWFRRCPATGWITGLPIIGRLF